MTIYYETWSGPPGLPFPEMPHIPEKREPTPIGQLFKARREELGLSKEDLASQANTGFLNVVAWETGPLALNSLQDILRILGAYLIVTPDGGNELITDTIMQGVINAGI